MTAPRKVFHPKAIARIREMKLAGAKGAEIAKEIGTTVDSLKVRCSQLGIKGPPRVAKYRDPAAIPRRRRVEPVFRSYLLQPAVRVGTVVKDDGVYHALDAGWQHLGWFSEHHEAKQAVRDHHDQQPDHHL